MLTWWLMRATQRDSRPRAVPRIATATAADSDVTTDLSVTRHARQLLGRAASHLCDMVNVLTCGQQFLTVIVGTDADHARDNQQRLARVQVHEDRHIYRHRFWSQATAGSPLPREGIVIQARTMPDR